MPTVIIVIEITNKGIIILHFLGCSCQNIKDSRGEINIEREEAKLCMTWLYS